MKNELFYLVLFCLLGFFFLFFSIRSDINFFRIRLINTAQIVRIHTLEWTGAILNTDFINESLIAQWYGEVSPRVAKILQSMNISIGNNSIPTHVNNPPDYRGVPFSLTEEFVSVYRMHSLLPDTIAIRQMSTGEQFIFFLSLQGSFIIYRRKGRGKDWGGGGGWAHRPYITNRSLYDTIRFVRHLPPPTGAVTTENKM